MDKEKEKEIEKMGEVVKNACNKKGIAKHCPERITEALVNAGYGDIKQAVKEFAEKASHLIHIYLDTETDYTPSMTCNEIFDKLFKEMYDHD